MAEEGLFQTIKNFLFSNMNKQFLIFVFFLILSAIFWLSLTLNEIYERELKVPVTIAKVPKSVVLTSADVDTVRVTVRDKGWVILSYLYGDKKPQLRLNFKAYDRGNGNGTVSMSEIKRSLDQKFENSTKISSVKPEKFQFFYNNGERKRVPVRWTGRIMPDQLYFIDHSEYQPDSVDVYASREKLDSIRYIETEQLNYTGFRDTLTIISRLSHPTDVKVVPERVTISFITDVLTEESILVPIKCLNLPPDKLVRTFPAKVKVNFVAGASRIRILHPDEFSVVADYEEIMQKPSDKCNLYLRRTPPGVSHASLSVKQVDYLIEENK